jgi:hypothetical protein
MEDKKIVWENLSNSSIKKELEVLMHQQETIKNKMLSLSEKLESVEREYLYGNKILTKRYSGE